MFTNLIHYFVGAVFFALIASGLIAVAQLLGFTGDLVFDFIESIPQAIGCILVGSWLLDRFYDRKGDSE